MSRPLLAFQNMTFTYETGLTPIIRDLTLQLDPGWTGVVGANGAGKTTLLKLAAGLLVPTTGGIQVTGTAVYCSQRMDRLPDRFEALIQAPDSEAWRIRGTLGIEPDWLHRWDTLSFGERKRAQIGMVLWIQPDILAVDEPTNHLDMTARKMVGDALDLFKGIALLVSHDRELLDRLCTRCVFIEAGRAELRPGKYEQGAEQIRREREYDMEKYARVKKDYVKLQCLAAGHREEASRANKKRSKRGIAKKDHDAKAKLNRARVTGKDGTSGRLLNQIQGRIWHTRRELESISLTKTYESGIWIPGSRSARNTLFSLPAGSLPLGRERALHFPDLLMAPDHRVALTGANGCGKSTLVRYILQHLNVPTERLIYMPQEISTQESRKILSDIQALSNDEKGVMMTVVSRLGSRPHRLLETVLPSPGEIRKCLLAMGVVRQPHLILMDEPTNHLDLPSIEALETALNDCPCGLLLVSHDLRFLSRLTTIHWRIHQSADGQASLTVERA